MDPNTNPAPPVMCTNCQAVTTADGKTLWVCENCGTENTNAPTTVAPEPVSPPMASMTPPAPLEQPSMAAPEPVPTMAADPMAEMIAPPMALPTEMPVMPEITAMPQTAPAPTPDVNMAQAEIDSAAATVSPMAEIPSVGLGDSASPIMGGSAPPMPPSPFSNS